MEIFTSSVTSKGQATIPRAVRDHLGIRPGSKVRFSWDPASPQTAKIMLDEPADLSMLMMMAQNFAPEWASPEDCEAFDHFESTPRGEW